MELTITACKNNVAGPLYRIQTQKNSSQRYTVNNKEFIAELARRTKLNTKETQQRLNFLVQEMTDRLCEEDTIMVSNFGTFETRKRLERVVVSPSTGQRMLVPPKIVVSFKLSGTLKGKIQ